MKKALLGAAAVALMFAFSSTQLAVADGKALLSQCMSNDRPDNVTEAQAKEFCTCLSESTDDQSVLDELTELMSKSPAEMQSSAPPSEGAQEAFRSCIPEGMGPPPAQ